MIYKYFCVLLIFILFLIFPNFVMASFSMQIISVDPQSVTNDEQEVLITASISGLPNPSFFRAAWQKASGDTYFGYVKNNSGDWVKILASQDCKNFFYISDLTTNSLVLTAKIGDDNVPQNGEYFIKLRRYTSTCGSNSDSDSFSVSINLPTPSPAPTISPPTPDPTSPPTPTPSKSSSPTPTKSPSPKPTATATPEVLGDATESATDVLALRGSLESKTDPPTPVSVSNKNFSKFPLIAGAFIFSGIGLIGFAGFMAFKKQKESSSGTIIK